MSGSRKIIWAVGSSFAAIFIPAFIAVILYAAVSFRSYSLESARTELASKAAMVGRIIEKTAPGLDQAEVDSLCKDMGRLVPVRFTVILPSGRVIGDSFTDSAGMENHTGRPEILGALAGTPSVNVRFSYTTGKLMMYAADPIRRGGEVVGVVRTSVFTGVLDRTLLAFSVHAGIGIFILAAIAVAFLLLVSMKIGRVFREINVAASRFSSGDLTHRLHTDRAYAETDALAEALNRMADQINTRIHTITAQRNELEAVLGSMAEAVVAVDSDERVINLNHSAETLFGVSIETARGRTIQEIIRNSRLQRFVKRILAGPEPVSGEMFVQFNPDRHLHATGAHLRDSDDRVIGALIVLNDITQLKKLETIRRDFVANVSHELKTPITSITGFVETLRDGAVRDPESADRFLDIILRQSDRLNAIIDDLLMLSRIEQESENETLRVEPVRLCDVIRNALTVCEPSAREKNITVEAGCPETVIVEGNAALLEQAIVNLLDNAVKYTNPDGRITVGAERTNGFAELRVEDTGIGIPEKDIPRIFERFYRVDKARSREMGGTGLGLAIVKHIVQAHRGSVEVSSIPGRGSVFTVRVPEGVAYTGDQDADDPSGT